MRSRQFQAAAAYLYWEVRAQCNALPLQSRLARREERERLRLRDSCIRSVSSRDRGGRDRESHAEVRLGPRAHGPARRELRQRDNALGRCRCASGSEAPRARVLNEAKFESEKKRLRFDASMAKAENNSFSIPSPVKPSLRPALMVWISRPQRVLPKPRAPPH